jgi:N-methylhydantoinase A
MLLGVDVGGTFTDAVLVDDDGCIYTAKAPSTPGLQEQGVMAAIAAVLAVSKGRPTRARETHLFEPEPATAKSHPPRARGTEDFSRPDAPSFAGTGESPIERFAHGMTVATNALLEAEAHPPARTALVATEGFTDIVELGRQARPSLYRLCEAGPQPLAPAHLRFGAPERMGPAGPLRELDESATSALLDRIAAAEPQAIAVVLLHSYAHPQHEQRLGELIAERMPDTHLSLSHELVGTFREYERASTTEIDAALSPLLSSYLDRLGAQAKQRGLPEVQVMQSSGGLCDAHRAARHAALTVLSGPAGGVGGALLLSEAGGERDLLCFDMGGTSCDVCLIDSGRVAESAQRTVAGRPLALPALDIHTVGAGGGSIAWRDPGGALRVGPESAGAEPGPACYGLGGERATVTDANLVLGRLLDDIPLAGGVVLDRDAAERAVGALANELGIGLLACAEGIVRVAETEMLRALAVMTVERGIDPRRFALMPFGGAGPLHAASMAAELGIERVLCPRACGVLSALGLAAAAPRRDASSTVVLSGATFTRERIEEALRALIERVSVELDGAVERFGLRYELRYRGQSFELTVEEVLHAEDCFGGWGVPTSNAPEADSHALRDPVSLREAFETAHEQRYGYRDSGAEVELVTVRVSAIGSRPALNLSGGADDAAGEHRSLERPVQATDDHPALERTRVAFDGEWLEAELWRGELPVGARVCGPALCAMPESTLLVPPGWNGAVDELGTVVLESARPERAQDERTQGAERRA